MILMVNNDGATGKTFESSDATSTAPKKTSLRMSAKTHSDLKKACIDLGISMGEAQDEAARDWLKKNAAKIKKARDATSRAKGGRA